MQERFEIIFLEDVRKFLAGVDEKSRAKILYNIDRVKIKNDPKLFKKITHDIWEFRTKYNKLHYRLFAFWDKRENRQTLVISTHGIIKKTDKIPKSDIKRAEKLRKEYFEQKQ